MTKSDQSRRRRKLAAILMVDVADFSRLMGEDEEGTTDRILEFHDLVRSGVEAYGGRVVATAGDSVFGDFASIVEALECAAQIQRDLHVDNAGRPETERISARIGLHLGDVIVEDDNVFGSGVNIAARIEPLAEPGGIALSEAVYQLVRGRTELPIERLGTKTLKNIKEPMSVYGVAAEVFRVEIPQAAPRRRRREGHDGDDSGARREGHRVVSLFKAGSLTLIALGVVGLLARTSGWSDNAWYPFLGAWLLALGVGGPIERMTGRSGLRTVISAVGIAIGAAFFDNAVTKAILWVIAAGVLGAGIQAMNRPPEH